jgi:hypothetical protein
VVSAVRMSGWVVTYVAHSTYGNSVLDNVCTRLCVHTATEADLRIIGKDFLLSYRIRFEHTTSAGEVFALMNAGATGLDFSRPLE